MPAATHPALRVIAAFKLLKVFALLVVAVAAFDLARSSQLDALAEWIERLPIHHGHRFLVRLLDSALQLGPKKFIAVGAAACVYARLFAVEGWGLWHGKRWAECLTAIATTSLIPFELWEIAHRFTYLKIGALVVNLVIVWYLVYLLRADRSTGPPAH